MIYIMNQTILTFSCHKNGFISGTDKDIDKIKTRAKGLMCLRQREDTEKLHIV